MSRLRDETLEAYLGDLDAWMSGAWRGSGVETVGIALRSASGSVFTRIHGDDTLDRHGQGAAPLFRIGSLSKVLAVASLLAAAQRGLIDLHVPLTRHVPELRFAETSPLAATTLADLAAHRSTMAQLELTALRRPDGRHRSPIPRMSEAQLFTRMRRGKVNGAGRGRRAFDYSDFGIAIIALAIARASRCDYATFATREVLRRGGVAGMYPTIDALGPDRAGRVLRGHAAPGLPAGPASPRTLGALEPAFGALATVDALTHFMHLLLGGRLLSPASTNRLFQARTPLGAAARGDAYAMGVARFAVGPVADGDACFGHLCVYDGFCGFSAHHPGTGVTMSILMNATAATPSPASGAPREPNPGGFVRGVFHQLAQIAGDPSSRPLAADLPKPPFWRRKSP